MKLGKKDKAFLANYKSHHDALQKIKKSDSLTSLLSNFLGLFPLFSFRHNTTSSFVALLKSLKLNTSQHTNLVYSDIEHPAFQKCIEHIWFDRKKIRLDCIKELISGNINKIEHKIAHCNDVVGDKSVAIYIISHVLWNCGVQLNIHDLAKKIKARKPNAIIIIDGVQAVGNISAPLLISPDESDIDFYLGCTHKWLGTSNLLGFISMNPKYKNTQVSIELLLGDLFSAYSGGEDVKRELCISTYNLLYLSQIIQELKMVERQENTRENNPVSQILNILKQYNITAPPIFIEKLTNFIGAFGNINALTKCREEHFLENSTVLLDTALPDNYAWLRIDISEM